MDINRPKHYNLIVDEAPVGIISYDYDENILVANKQMCFYLEKSSEELIGKNIKIILEEANPETLIFIDSVKNHNSVYEEFFPVKINTKQYYFNIKGVILPEQGLLIFENATAAKIYQDDLKKLDQTKDEFISIASHDLRTPLTAIRGYLDMVLKEEVGVIATPKMKEYIGLAREGALRLNDLVQDILSVSRIEQQRLKYQLQEVDIVPIIERIVSESEVKAKDKNIYLKFEKPKDNLNKVQTDPNRFMEILDNLITNAIKFTSNGGVTIKVLPREDHIRIDCIDTGIGMTSDNQKKIFQKFFQLNSSTSSQNQSTGLGLFISKMMTEKMGGRLVVNSAPSKGSDLFFTVPTVNSPIAKRVKDDILKEEEHQNQK